MRAVGVFALPCLISLFMLAACGGNHSTGPSVSTGNDADGGEDRVCVDEDGDGYGRFCDLGSDCDDNDPEITDECRRCGSPNKDCPCKPGTRALSCTPAIQHVAGGTLVCKEGSRYCRAGYWSDCETIGQYVFVADP